MAMRDNEIEPRPGICYFVLLAEPNRELTAQANLVIRHIPFYLPTIFRPARLRARQHQARLSHPDVPIALFPRMLFIAEDVIQRSMELIRTAPGMQSQPFLKFGDQFAVIRPVGMAAIQSIEATEREKYFARKRKHGAPSWLPQIGQEVKILLDEIMGGLQGMVSDVDEKGRIAILTEIMKRTVRVHVTANQIEPV